MLDSAGQGTQAGGGFDPYVPRAVLARLAAGSPPGPWAAEGTMVFCDLSGFTRLSEQLQRRGREGAELLAGAINDCFSDMLGVAHLHGGSLVKFGGDALLLFFEGNGHAARACRAAHGMRAALRALQPVRAGDARVILRMTVGIHSDVYHFFLAGSGHLECLLVGEAVTAVARTEEAARSGQIVVSDATGRALPGSCLGPVCGPGRLLRRAPSTGPAPPADPAPAAEGGSHDGLVARGLSTAVRGYLLDGSQPPEHRLVTVAFLTFKGTDALMATSGPDATGAALSELVATVAEAADEHGVCFLGSDVDADGGKIILCAGAPRATGEDEQRMLLTLRRILDRGPSLPIAIGVNRGPAFAGEIGTAFRRVYTLMGDTVNLSARLMAKAEAGRIYATAGVLEQSAIRFTTTAVEPFVAKGKALPILAWDVGPARARSAAERGDDEPGTVSSTLPLVGRDEELGVLTRSLVAATEAGRGSLIELTGPGGIGKTRLLTEARAQAAAMGMACYRVICEAYSSAVPYSPWHRLCRETLGLAEDAPDDVTAEHLRSWVAEHDPGLAPMLPLLGEVAGVDMPATPEVDSLSEQYRRPATHDAVLRLLAPLRDRPTFVEIDEANSLDEASRALLAAAVDRLSPSRWVMVIAGRDDPDGGEMVAPAGGVVTHLTLGSLPPDAARLLAEAATESTPLPPHVSALAVERSGGHPQFLLDVMRVAAAGQGAMLPESAGAAATARLDTLPPADRALVRRASVLGAEFSRQHVEAIRDAGQPPPDRRTWRRLADIFEDRGKGGLRFRSGLVRDAAYSSLPFRLRRELHAAAAAALLADDPRSRPGGLPDPAVLSLHLLLAGDYAAALPLAVAAAEHASSRAAPADAARLYRRALEAARGADAPPENLADLWEALGVALRRAGETAAADEAWSAARRLVPDDRIRQARLYDRHSGLANRSGRLGASLRWARRGIRALQATTGDDAERWRVRLAVMVASVRYAQGRYRESVRLCRQVIADAERIGEEPALAKASYVLAVGLEAAGIDEGTGHAVRALEIYRRLGRDEEAAVVVNNLGVIAYWDGRWDEALLRYREGAELCDRVGDVCGAAYGDCNVGEVLSDQGHYEEAAAALLRAQRTWRATADDEGVAMAGMFLGRLATRRGRPDEAAELLRAAAESLAALGLDADAAMAEAFRAEAAAFLGRDGCETAFEILDRLEGVPDTPAPLLSRVRAFALAGAGAGAAVVAAALETALVTAREAGADFDVAVTLDALCRLDFDGQVAPGRCEERDALLARFGIVRLPDPPLGLYVSAYPGIQLVGGDHDGDADDPLVPLAGELALGDAGAVDPLGPP